MKLPGRSISQTRARHLLSKGAKRVVDLEGRVSHSLIHEVGSEFVLTYDDIPGGWHFATRDDLLVFLERMAEELSTTGTGRESHLLDGVIDRVEDFVADAPRLSESLAQLVGLESVSTLEDVRALDRWLREFGLDVSTLRKCIATVGQFFLKQGGDWTILSGRAGRPEPWIALPNGSFANPFRALCKDFYEESGVALEPVITYPVTHSKSEIES
ncbi:MAG: hypothetical protein H7Y17_16380 [Chlorobia bacterium]|nr:hypothetical protein [Fimbriimonadaceae bacterium]